MRYLWRAAACVPVYAAGICVDNETMTYKYHEPMGLDTYWEWTIGRRRRAIREANGYIELGLESHAKAALMRHCVTSVQCNAVYRYIRYKKSADESVFDQFDPNLFWPPFPVQVGMVYFQTDSGKIIAQGDMRVGMTVKLFGVGITSDYIKRVENKQGFVEIEKCPTG